MNKEYFYNQTRLLLRVLPLVLQDSRFALKGGTAINLFIRDMPRISVDIDLTYLPIEDRETSLKGISDLRMFWPYMKMNSPACLILLLPILNWSRQENS